MASAEEGEAIQAPGILETIHLEHVPSTHTVHVGLFKDVTNADFLQKQLLSRNSEFEYAFIDATSVCFYGTSVFLPLASPITPVTH